MRSIVGSIALSGALLLLCSNTLRGEIPSASKSAQIEKSLVVSEKTDRIVALKKELGLSDKNGPLIPEEACHLILVQQGNSIWNDEGRLQGWTNVPLSDSGRAKVKELSKQLADVNISSIYCSDLDRSKETAAIIAQNHDCPIASEFALRGEAHGSLEGLLQAEYRQDSHYKKYKSLLPEEKIFFSFGDGGESKADVARRMVPLLQAICKENPGKTVVIVTHGGNIKFLNYLMGNYTDESFAELPHGTCLRVDSDGRSFVRK